MNHYEHKQYNLLPPPITHRQVIVEYDHSAVDNGTQLDEQEIVTNAQRTAYQNQYQTNDLLDEHGEPDMFELYTNDGGNNSKIEQPQCGEDVVNLELDNGEPLSHNTLTSPSRPISIPPEQSGNAELISTSIGQWNDQESRSDRPQFHNMAQSSKVDLKRYLPIPEVPRFRRKKSAPAAVEGWHIPADWPPPKRDHEYKKKRHILSPPEDSPLHVRIQAYAMRWACFAAEIKDDAKREQVLDWATTKMQKSWDDAVKIGYYPKAPPQIEVVEDKGNEDDGKKKGRPRAKDASKDPAGFTVEGGKDKFAVTNGELAQKGLTFAQIQKRVDDNDYEDPEKWMAEAYERIGRDEFTISDWSKYKFGSVVGRNLEMYALWAAQEATKDIEKMKVLMKAFKHPGQKKNTQSRIDAYTNRRAQFLALAWEIHVKEQDNLDEVSKVVDLVSEDDSASDQNETEETTHNSSIPPLMASEAAIPQKETPTIVQATETDISITLQQLVQELRTATTDEQIKQIFQSHHLDTKSFAPGSPFTTSNANLTNVKLILADICREIQQIEALTNEIGRHATNENVNELKRTKHEKGLAMWKLSQARQRLMAVADQEISARSSKQPPQSQNCDMSPQQKSYPSPVIPPAMCPQTSALPPQQLQAQPAQIQSSARPQTPAHSLSQPQIHHTQVQTQTQTPSSTSQICTTWPTDDEVIRAVPDKGISGNDLVRTFIHRVGPLGENISKFVSRIRLICPVSRGFVYRPGTLLADSQQPVNAMPSTIPLSSRSCQPQIWVQQEQQLQLPKTINPAMLVRNLGPDSLLKTHATRATRSAPSPQQQYLQPLTQIHPQSHAQRYSQSEAQCLPPQVQRSQYLQHSQQYQPVRPPQLIQPSHPVDVVPQKPSIKLNFTRKPQYQSTVDESDFGPLHSSQINSTKGFAFRHLPHSTFSQRQKAEDAISSYITHSTGRGKKRPWGRYIIFFFSRQLDNDDSVGSGDLAHGFWNTKDSGRVPGSEWFYAGYPTPEGIQIEDMARVDLSHFTDDDQTDANMATSAHDNNGADQTSQRNQVTHYEHSTYPPGTIISHNNTNTPNPTSDYMRADSNRVYTNSKKPIPTPIQPYKRTDSGYVEAEPILNQAITQSRKRARETTNRQSSRKRTAKNRPSNRNRNSSATKGLVEDDGSGGYVPDEDEYRSDLI